MNREGRAILLSVVLAAASMSVWGQTAGETGRPEQFRVWGGTAREDAYLADGGTGSTGGSYIVVGGAEKAEGFVVFTKGPAGVIPNEYVPGAGDRCTGLAAHDCRGEYGPMTFGILALEGGEFKIETTDLTGPGGKAIKAENLDVRAVRYAKVSEGKETRSVPLLIETFEKKNIASGHFVQFWITYYVPEGASPGTYAGKVRIRMNGVEKKAIPLTLEVYPFKLAEPQINFYICQGNVPQQEDAGAFWAALVDERCHGMTTVELGAPVTNDGELKAGELGKVLDTVKKAGMPGREVFVGLYNRIAAEWLNTPDKGIKMYCPWFRYYPFSEKLDRRYVEAVKAIRDEAAKRGYTVNLATADEPGSHPWTIEAAQHYYDLVKREVPGVGRELTVGGGWAMGQTEDELWKGRLTIWSTNRWLEDKLGLVMKGDPKARVQIYNMGGKGSDGGGIESVRAMYGFFCWKTGAKGATQWAYHHTGTPAENYTWPAREQTQAHVPTLRWEMMREGVKDRRYIATLEKKLEGKEGKGAEEARKEFEEMREKIAVTTAEYDPIGGGRVSVQPPGTYDRWRERIAELIKGLP